MRRIATVITLGMITCVGGANVCAQLPGTVRPEGGGVERLLVRGVERSPTFRQLLSQFGDADLVVYVRFSRCSGGVPACLLWASSGSGPRRLLIKLDPFDRSEDDLTALLAHELQHARAVATAPDVNDAVSFQKLFERDGWKGSHGFETKQARDAARKVRAELVR